MHDCDKDKMMSKTLNVFPEGAAFSGKCETTGWVSRVRELEKALPIGYTIIETETLRKASDQIAFDAGTQTTLTRKINGVIKSGLPE